MRVGAAPGPGPLRCEALCRLPVGGLRPLSPIPKPLRRKKWPRVLEEGCCYPTARGRKASERQSAFRPIALTTGMSKVTGHIIAGRARATAGPKTLPYQAGFRPPPLHTETADPSPAHHDIPSEKGEAPCHYSSLRQGLWLCGPWLCHRSHEVVRGWRQSHSLGVSFSGKQECQSEIPGHASKTFKSTCGVPW
ncbi:hypothetical protein DQ04_16821010 [Trypanosoma grayi]|uniref:hypothetical protein n=1 Tax=Trypanosoma grayi TaxID=71804 RepID=UPI0004F4B549|nr:hypothetical protein DQ04_16821010 [Trypanosoma grayi]KEG05985.1 hypothetical protein DQ04_16821010 [Trypanosoma grayi]